MDNQDNIVQGSSAVVVHVKSGDARRLGSPEVEEIKKPVGGTQVKISCALAIFRWTGFWRIVFGCEDQRLLFWRASGIPGVDYFHRNCLLKLVHRRYRAKLHCQENLPRREGQFLKGRGGCQRKVNLSGRMTLFGTHPNVSLGEPAPCLDEVQGKLLWRVLEEKSK
jgi:hypothetical protein